MVSAQSPMKSFRGAIHKKYDSRMKISLQVQIFLFDLSWRLLFYYSLHVIANPSVFKKNSSKIRINPFFLKKSRTLLPLSEVALG